MINKKLKILKDLFSPLDTLVTSFLFVINRYCYLYLHNISIEIILTDIFLSIGLQVAHFPLYQDKDV